MILKDLNVKKSPGPDLLPPKLIKLVKDIKNQPLKDVSNHIILSCIFSDNGKVAHVTPCFKTDKKDRQNKSHYRPISVIGVFSKIVERYIEMKINEHIVSVTSFHSCLQEKVQHQSCFNETHRGLEISSR